MRLTKTVDGRRVTVQTNDPREIAQARASGFREEPAPAPKAAPAKPAKS